MSLYTRLTSPEGDEVKIPIHGFSSGINELRQGYMTRAELIAMFVITPAEETQLDQIKDLVAAAPNKVLFLRVFKDCLYLAEMGNKYATVQEFVTRLQDEVTDQGGTP